MGVTRSRSRIAKVERLEQRELLSAEPWEIEARLGRRLLELGDASLAPEQRARRLENLVADGDSVTVQVKATDSVGKLKAELRAVGFQETLTYRDLIVGDLPFTAINALTTMKGLAFVRPVVGSDLDSGTVLSQADLSMRSDEARLNTRLASLPVNGEGVKIGVISDSYNFLGWAATDVAEKELPGAGNPDYPTPVQVLADAGNSDEGRAMLQLIHDIAPGSTLMFHAGATSIPALATAIDNLVAAGADVIVDDVSPRDEPFFQDSVAAQAVANAVAAGVAYFSSGGNVGPRHYQSAFAPGDVLSGFGRMHDFDPGPGVDSYQEIRIPAGAGVRFMFQWDQPYATAGPIGSATDLDISLWGVDPVTNTLEVVATERGANYGYDPQEWFEFTNVSNYYGDTFQLVITCVNPFDRTQPCAPADYPQVMKYIMRESRIQSPDYPLANYDVTIEEWPGTDNGGVYGHHNVANMAAVTAAYYHYGPDFTPSQSPQLEYFSPAGNVPILFNTNGTRKATPEVRQQPFLTSVDGTNTSLRTLGFNTDTSDKNEIRLPIALDDPDDYGNFFGTSASAPHAAAVAALVLDANPNLTPVQVLDILKTTAKDQGPAGYDPAWGHGLVDALGAVYKAFKPSVTDMTAATDNGSSQTDNITTVKRPAFTGTAPAGSWVELLIDGVPRGSQQLAAGATTYSITVNANLAQSSHVASVRIAENSSIPVGNRSRLSDPLSFVIGRKPPRATSQALVGDNSDSIPTTTENTDELDLVLAVDIVRSTERQIGGATSSPTTSDSRRAVTPGNLPPGTVSQYSLAKMSESASSTMRQTPRDAYFAMLAGDRTYQKREGLLDGKPLGEVAWWKVASGL